MDAGGGYSLTDSSAADRRAQLASCVHCGFCLPTCPTYVLWGEEMDSPRGRLQLMKAEVDGRVSFDSSVVRRMDACLGCLACVTACPSGVEYGPLIEATRGEIERSFDRPVADRVFRQLLFTVLPYPTRLRALGHGLGLALRTRSVLERLGWLERLPARLRALVRLAPDRPADRHPVSERTPPVGSKRATVGLLTGCVQRVFFGDVNRATVNVLAAEGCEVIAPRGQGCCGALSLHAGREMEAKAFARRLIAEFERLPAEIVVANVAGCGSAMKDYGRLFSGDASWAGRAATFSSKVRDVSEAVQSLQPVRTPRHSLSLRVVYHDACHLAHGQGVREAPRKMLRAIPGLVVTTAPEAELCCGSAGIYNLVQPDAAEALGVRKIEGLRQVSADVVATGNAGCLLQLAAAARAAGRPIRVVHPIQILDASIRGTGL